MGGDGATTALLFLTYRRLPSFEPGGYEDWLVAEDNPFFNSIGGILEYQNWAVETVSAGDPGFDYFDLLYLDGPEALEQVWFDPELTAFRRGWVARWGYGPAPLEVNRHGWLLSAAQPRQPVATERLRLAIGDRSTDGGEDWTLIERLPKHYARPVDDPPDPWHEPAGSPPALGGRVLALMPEGAEGGSAAVSLTARRIAPPVGLPA